MTIDFKQAGLAVPSGNFADVDPRKVSYRRLERDKHGDLQFVAPFKAERVTSDNWQDVLAGYARKPAKDGGQCKDFGAFDETVSQGQPPVTPLSINLEQPVFVLVHLDDNSRLQFSARGSGVTVDDYNAHLTALGGKLVTSGGQVEVVTTPEFPGEGSAIEADCRFAFFAVAPPKGSGVFALPFNLHLEQTGQIGKVPYTIPIMIDPDTRHPGGGHDP